MGKTAAGEDTTWNSLPRWVQKQRNWYRRYRDELGKPPPDPEWGDDDLSQSMKKLYELAKAKFEVAEPRTLAWYEFEGDRAAEEVLIEWCEHLRCPECDMFGPPADFGEEWGTVVCPAVDCEHVWAPEWVTPWGPPTPKSVNPAKYTFSECPICGQRNRRLRPESPYDFVCHLPVHESAASHLDLAMFLLGPEAVEEDRRRREQLHDEWRAIYEGSCRDRYNVGLAEGWYRFLPVWFPFCRGCGARFAARLPDQEYCSRDCGPMPSNFSGKLRRMATSVSPVLRRQEVFERDGWVCHICGQPVAQHPVDRFGGASLDHVVPIARGGTHTMDNVKTAHLRCNIKKSDRMLDEDELSFLRSLLQRRKVLP